MELRIAFIGFGNVARAFAQLLDNRSHALADRYGLSWRTVAISTARHGSVTSEDGIDLSRAIDLQRDGRQLYELKGCRASDGPVEIAQLSAMDVIFETTPLNVASGEPATTFIRPALARGISVITANKGPVAFAYDELSDLAKYTGACFRFEGTVMDGAPVFNLAEYCLPGAEVLGFSGVLNSTTNLILTGMESGRSFDECLKEAQSMGIAEAEPDYDIDGWDSAVKAVALANVLMSACLSPKDVRPDGIRGMTAADLSQARKSGHTIRLVCSATRSKRGVEIRVGPERVPQSSLFASLKGTDNALLIHTDLMNEIAIVERNPQVEQTAYALLSDMIRVHSVLSERGRGQTSKQ